MGARNSAKMVSMMRVRRLKRRWTAWLLDRDAFRPKRGKQTRSRQQQLEPAPRARSGHRVEPAPFGRPPCARARWSARGQRRQGAGRRLARRLGRPPAQIVAQIAPGIARQHGRHAAAADGGEQAARRRRHRNRRRRCRARSQRDAVRLPIGVRPAASAHCARAFRCAECVALVASPNISSASGL